MARLLHASGEHVDLLILADPIPPTRYGGVVRAMLKVVCFFRAADSAGRRDQFEYLSDRMSAFYGVPLRRRPAAIFRFARRLIRRRLQRQPGFAHAAKHPQLLPTPLAQLFLQHIHAEYAYRHAPYEGRVDLIVTPAAEHRRKRPPALWAQVASHLVMHRADAGHSEIVFTHMPGILRDQLARVMHTGTPE